mgnify:CR=1 FL=1
MMGAVKPVLISIVVCDTVIRDDETRKLSLIGIFNTISSQKFPCVHARLHVYVAVTDGEGKARGRLQLMDNDTNQPLQTFDGEIYFPDRFAVIEMNFVLMNMNFPKPGIYRFDFWVDGDIIGQRRFHVNEAPQQQKT